MGTRVARRVAGCVSPGTERTQAGLSRDTRENRSDDSNDMSTSRPSSHQQHAADWVIGSRNVVGLLGLHTGWLCVREQHAPGPRGDRRLSWVDSHARRELLLTGGPPHLAARGQCLRVSNDVQGFPRRLTGRRSTAPGRGDFEASPGAFGPISPTIHAERIANAETSAASHRK